MSLIEYIFLFFILTLCFYNIIRYFSLRKFKNEIKKHNDDYEKNLKSLDSIKREETKLKKEIIDVKKKIKETENNIKKNTSNISKINSKYNDKIKQYGNIGSFVERNRRDIEVVKSNIKSHKTVITKIYNQIKNK